MTKNIVRTVSVMVVYVENRDFPESAHELRGDRCGVEIAESIKGLLFRVIAGRTDKGIRG